MQSYDVGAIVPSTRDLLQVISTRRKSMALVALVGPEAPAKDAVRLHELNISALAFAEAGPAMEAGARATKTVPTLCLSSIGDREGALAARFHGADGVCVDALLPIDDWDRIAKGARTMRMLPIALATGAEGVAAALKVGARAILIRGASAEEIRAAAAGIPRNLTIVAEVVDADAATLRALVGHVDAAVVPLSLHAAPGFEALVSEIDP